MHISNTTSTHELKYLKNINNGRMQQSPIWTKMRAGEMRAVYICRCTVYTWCVSLFQPMQVLTLVSLLLHVFGKTNHNTKWRTEKSVQTNRPNVTCLKSQWAARYAQQLWYLSTKTLFTPPSLGRVKQIKRPKPSTPKHAKQISFI